ncbi:MAG TPA: recombinase A, partial [Candidatus Hydrogenedentes bacterium]|nr:recombinase A [Candidatus Hydrogenedentota bacterium]
DQASLRLETFLGRFVEIGGGSATAGLTLCARLICEAQRDGGMAAWVGGTCSSFFPPDLAAAGVDLAALAVVRVEDSGQQWRACDILLRSGGFVLVVADMAGGIGLPLSAQSRLAGLAQHHHAALIALTREIRREVSRGSLVSLRAETTKRRAGHDCFVCEARVVKDKRRAPGWAHEELRRGTDGLC